MSVEFSHQILQRAVFLHERDIPLEEPSELPGHLESPTAPYRSLNERYERWRNGFQSRTSEIEAGHVPDWVLALPLLTETVGSTLSKSEQSSIEHAVLHTVFGAPFLKLATNFGDELKHVFDNILSEHALVDLCCSLTQRVIHISKYVLYQDYLKSGRTYSSWSHTFLDKGTGKSPWSDICREYPVLTRFIFEAYCRTRDAYSGMLQRYQADRELMASVLSREIPKVIDRIDTDLSDPHRGGQTVARIKYAMGDPIIYKPKSLAVDQSIRSLSDRYSNELSLRVVRSIDRGDYGWCENSDDAQRGADELSNPRALGKATAFYWLINSTDLHSENAIPGPEGLLAIDLETVLQPFVPKRPLVWRDHSVFSTSLFDYSYGSEPVQNISGILPSRELGVIAKNVEFSLHDNELVASLADRPRVSSLDENIGSAVPSEIAREMTVGFCALADHDHRQILTSFVRSLNPKTRVRIVLRDTAFYARIFDRIYQPRLLRDAGELHTDLLKLHWAVAENETHKGQVAPATERAHCLVDEEIVQILDGDIPYFFTEIDSRALFGRDAIIEDFFVLDGRSAALTKVDHFENSDVREQISLIEIALGTYQPHVIEPSFSSDKDAITALRKTLLNSAFTPKNEPARWISMYGDAAGTSSKVTIGEEGYFSGALGILLAIEASSFDRSDGFLDAQSKLWARTLATRSKFDRPGADIGIVGVGGEIANLCRLSLLSQRWREASRSGIPALLSWAKTGVLSVDSFDVIAGTSGLLLSCIQLCETPGLEEWHEEAADLAALCAKKLMASVIEYEGVKAWPYSLGNTPLMGFAHGWAGAYGALLRSQPILEPGLFDEVSDFLSELSAFPLHMLQKDGAWLDYRDEDKRSPLNRSWCNGSTGLLRTVFAANGYMSPGVLEEADRLLDETQTALMSSEEYRFCCGEFGVIDLLLDLQGSDVFGSKIVARSELKRICVRAIETVTRERSPTITPERSFPSLFHGLAGMLFTGSRFFEERAESLSLMPVQKERPALCMVR